MNSIVGRLIQILALGVLAVTYGPVLIELVRDWIRDPNYQHGFLMPVISGYLVWNVRKDLRAASAKGSIWGLVGLLLSGTLFALGTAGAEAFTQRVSFVTTLASLVLFLYGWRFLRLTIFPIAFLLLAIPLPYVIYYGLTAPMQALAAKVAIFGMNVFGVQAVGQGNMIHLSATSLEVAEACSGIRSLYAFLAVGALVANFTPAPLWGQIVIFLLAIPMSVVGNAIRVLGTGLGAYLIGPEATEGTVHELFGLLVFVISLGIFMLIKHLAGKVWLSDTSSPSSSSPSPASMPVASGQEETSRRRSLHWSDFPES